MNATTETPCEQLLNAVHIQRIIDSVKARPEVWVAAYIGVHGEAWSAAGNTARKAMWDTATEMASDAAWAAWDAGNDTGMDYAGSAARDAVLALVTHDDAAQYLDLTIDELKALYASTGHPATLLLQPAVVAFASVEERFKRESKGGQHDD